MYSVWMGLFIDHHLGEYGSTFDSITNYEHICK